MPKRVATTAERRYQPDRKCKNRASKANDVVLEYTNINNEQLVNLEATHIRVNCSKVTSVGIRNLTKKWIDNDYPIGSKFEIYIDPKKSTSEEEFFEGLEYEYDGEFRKIKMRPGKAIRVDFREYTKKIIGEIYFDTNWNDMPNEVKVMIMDNMDLITRFRLKMCSKSDKSLVETFPMIIQELVAFREQWDGPGSFALIGPSVNGGGSEECLLEIKQQLSRVTISREGTEEKVRDYSTEGQAFEAIENYFHNILLTKNIRIENLFTEFKLNDSYIPAYHMFHFNSVNIECCDIEERVEWLKHLAPGVRKIRSKSYIKIAGDVPCVLNAKELHFKYTDIKNEQLINFKATQLTMDKSNVTIEGIRAFIKKWIDEDYPIESKFEISFESTSRPTIEQLFDGDEVERNGSTSKTMVQMGRSKVMCIAIKSHRFSTHFIVESEILNKT